LAEHPDAAVLARHEDRATFGAHRALEVRTTGIGGIGPALAAPAGLFFVERDEGVVEDVRLVHRAAQADQVEVVVTVLKESKGAGGKVCLHDVDDLFCVGHGLFLARQVRSEAGASFTGPNKSLDQLARGRNVAKT
jgi:hypothetical protein